eukprot:CAMPEP_0197471746 /NCGR_PEP_ID=MMETSP1309-20131121/2737_1 /TAXON_ID=464262 /ORGANISM="Genus nov. species nov., Strain RCC998" /LENGTH=37 /DNA_ID= /DNA_START= /DNA_END= /DNA_ORIENTATION=
MKPSPSPLPLPPPSEPVSLPADCTWQCDGRLATTPRT